MFEEPGHHTIFIVLQENFFCQAAYLNDHMQLYICQMAEMTITYNENLLCDFLIANSLVHQK